MSDDRRKTNKQSTGTVPKIKPYNVSYSSNDGETSSAFANNLTSYRHQPPDPFNIIRNRRRNQQNNYFTMDTAVEEPCLPSVQNGLVNFNTIANGASANTSSSNSRRNSSGSTLKCDNITKYPDKKQIEQKLHQIREYLKITNSLMSSMRNTDEQSRDPSELESLEKMIKDLTDSEKKLTDILDQFNNDDDELNDDQMIENGVDDMSEHSASSSRRNYIDINLDNPNHEVDCLKEQQLALMQLQQKAERKLKDAREIQSNLLQRANDSNSIANIKDGKNYADFDAAIKELEERAQQLRPPEPTNKIEDNFMMRVETLHGQIIGMHNANDEREQLIEALDNRDAELRTQHAELQCKLVELQNKKSQVDQLVSQLQSFGDEEQEDVGGQVRKIVTMKDQLKKLKDMLEIVKTTENIMQNTNTSAEVQAAACDICTTAENFLDKHVPKPITSVRASNDANNVLTYDNDTSSDGRPKQVNKNTTDRSGRGVDPNAALTINQKLTLQRELDAKKKELEEIMGKHKASTSNLNHDVGVDTKSEFSCTSNNAWAPLIPQHHSDSDDRFSSDDCQEDYTELHDNHNLLSLPSMNFSPSNAGRRRRAQSQPRNGYVHHLDSERSCTPERNVRSSSAATTGYIREQPRSNSEQGNKTQVQKQLQLIKSVCDSMLEQQQQQTSTTSQQSSSSTSNVQQLRNNLTPSPLYSEPRRFASPHSHPSNTINIVQPNGEAAWLPQSTGVPNTNLNNDMNNYQNWLATNSIQTQSFMLNTLNQCCQMLWMQQREIVALKNTVVMLQERVDCNHFGATHNHLAPSLQTPTQDHRSSNHFPPNPNQKVNHHVPTAFSLPNLSQANVPPTNMTPNYINESCLNNVNANAAAQSVEHANNLLHCVNPNINHTLSNQMWSGQALNNQVAPGNRANNYWDNFRSYSRQNLLSTKNTEILSNPPTTLERSNTLNDRTNPFTLISLSKGNSEHGSTATSQETTPRRRGVYNVNTAPLSQPDVLNVNHNNPTKVGEEQQQTVLPARSITTASSHHHSNIEDVSLGLQMLLNLNTFNDAASSNHSNVSEEQVPLEGSRRSNEWSDEGAGEEQLPKSKLFEELRENVYKEVASLISANETRPHFLIQLFRDLQMIGSDSLRLKILQSIQMVVTSSVNSLPNSNRPSLESQQTTSDQDVSHLPDNFSMQPTVWSKTVKHLSNPPRSDNDYSEYQNILKEILPFLSEHENDVVHNHLLATLKQLLLGSSAFKEVVKDAVFQKHFSHVLDEVLDQFCGKKVRDIRANLIQTVNELLCGELGFIQFIQETAPETCLSHHTSEVSHDSTLDQDSRICEQQKNAVSAGQPVDNIQNGDLAEADQSRSIGDDVEEEGAVGGILDVVECEEVTQSTCEDVDLAAISYPNVEGLDQVPTRLPIKVKSRSSTPSRGNRDSSNPHPEPDSF